MKNKIILFFSIFLLLVGIFAIPSSAIDSPYARRFRPFIATPVTCSENEVGYNMTLHKFYGCDNTGYKEFAIVGSSSFAPTNATFITQTPNATLSNEQALSALATGILKNTTTTGVLSIALAGTDYESPLTFSSPLSRSVNTISCPTCVVTASSPSFGSVSLTSFLELANQANPTTPTAAGRVFFDSSNRLSWIGTNGFVRTFDGTALTASRIYVLPDLAGTVALTANNLSVFASTTSAQIAGVLSDEVGTDKLVFNTNPTLVGITITAQALNSYNSAVSSPASLYTGTWIAGGSTTTNKPHFLIEPIGTTSTAWSVLGTGIGVNAASGFTGNLLELQVNATGRARFSASGNNLALFQTNTSTSVTSGAVPLELSNVNSTTNNWAHIYFTDAPGGGFSAAIAAQFNDHTNDYGKLEFLTSAADGRLARLDIRSTGEIVIASAAPLGWASTGASSGTVDATISRNAAGIVQIGTTAANANGTILATKFCYSGTVCDYAGTGSPESVVTASVGSTYRRTDGGAVTSFYVKESGAGNTGWVAK